MDSTKKSSCIYRITNVINNKIYIGSTINASKRWIEHKRDLNKQNHHNALLQNAWNKYGEENFVFEIIEEVLDKSKLLEREQYHLDTLNPVYNICKTTNKGFNRNGLINSIEHREKLKLAWIERRKRKEKRRAHKKRTKKSEETKQKIRNALLGRFHSEETKEKIRQKAIGRKISEETRIKLSLIKKGKKPNNCINNQSTLKIKMLVDHLGRLS
jgi:group I intron endonuclease